LGLKAFDLIRFFESGGGWEKTCGGWTFSRPIQRLSSYALAVKDKKIKKINKYFQYVMIEKG
jgi:hypothetical protein